MGSRLVVFEGSPITIIVMATLQSPSAPTVSPVLLIKAYVLAVAIITVCFVIPSIGLCHVLPRREIVWAIAGMTLISGIALIVRGWFIRSAALPAHAQSALLYIVSGFLTLTAGILWPMLAS